MKYLKDYPSKVTKILKSLQHGSKLYSTKTQEKIVIISKSKNIYENLALEDWLYKNGDLNNKTYLLMWQNTPAVVIGRHQNPWLECDVNSILRQNIDLARRNSGGGTVFHDEGNLNCSFLMSRKLYNRSLNLQLVVDAVMSKWGDVDLTINSRDDLVLNGLYKVSGTAAKLGGDKTYHHFTLLINVNKSRLQDLLRSPMTGVKTRATESVPSHIMNLQEANPGINFGTLTEAITDKFLQSQKAKTKEEVYPCEQHYPEFTKIYKDLKSFNWIFGKTPDFTIKRTFVAKIDLETYCSEICVDIRKGVVHNLSVSTKPTFTRITEQIQAFNGVPFSAEELLPLLKCFENTVILTSESTCDKIMNLWILDCIKQVFNI